MDCRETSDIFPHCGRRLHNSNDGKCNERRSTSNQSSILDKLKAERDTLSCQAETLCASGKARSDAVLKRLGLSIQGDLLSSHAPTSTRNRPESAQQGRRSWPFPVRLMTIEHIMDCCWRSPCRWCVSNDDEEEEEQWHGDPLVAQHVARQRCCGPARSSCSPASLSSVDTSTPSELRAISLVRSPDVMLHPPALVVPRGRPSRLPLRTKRLGEEVKVIAGGFKVPTAQHKIKCIQERLGLPSAQPPVVARESPMIKTDVPAPPPPALKRRERPPRLPRAVSGADLQAVGQSGLRAASTLQLRPLHNPAQSLSLCFELLASDNWVKKTEALRTLHTLAQHHQGMLKTKLHKVCLALSKEVQSLRSVVACAAMDTIGTLYVHLQRDMDAEAEVTGRALLLKIAQSAANAFVQHQANATLDVLVQSCSPGRVLSALLNTGLSHRCPAVRASTGQHLQQMADFLGAARILTAGKHFTQRFLIAVSKISLDAAAEVRHHGHKVLQGFVFHRDFVAMWTKSIPENDRRQLDKFLKTAK